MQAIFKMDAFNPVAGNTKDKLTILRGCLFHAENYGLQIVKL